jgi:hypothetical protein
VRGPCGRCVEGGILLEGPTLEPLEVGTRLDPETVQQLGPRGLVRGERLRLPAGAVEGEHESAAQQAATPLTSHHRPATYVELGIDILVKGIEAAAPAPQPMTACWAAVHRERLAPEAGCRRAAPGANPITRLNALANAASEL